MKKVVHFESEIFLRTSRLDIPFMFIAFVRRHLALLYEKQRVERADTELTSRVRDLNLSLLAKQQTQFSLVEG